MEAAAGDGTPFGEKTAEVVLRPGRSGGPNLWGACLAGCIVSFREKVVELTEQFVCKLDSVSIDLRLFRDILETLGRVRQYFSCRSFTGFFKPVLIRFYWHFVP